MKAKVETPLPPNNLKLSSYVARAEEILKTIPKLGVKEVRSRFGQTSVQPNINLLLRYGNKYFKVAVEPISSGEPSVLRRSAIYLKNLITKTKQDYAVIVAPFITGEGAAVCRDLGVGFIDLSGNCVLSLEGLYVERTGYPNKFKKPREILSFFSPKSSRVARCLLSEPERAWELKGLATETGVSIGLIHRIATGLENNLFARKEFRSFKLEDPARLLEAWREEYYRRPPKWSRYIARVSSLEELVSNLRTAALHHGVRYGLTGPSGASFIFSYMTPTVVHFYVDVLKHEFLADLKADSVPSEGNLLIRVAEKENEFIGSREVKDVCVVSDLQLYLNLWAMGGRGQEAAEELRRISFPF
jgi:hypothetical protein